MSVSTYDELLRLARRMPLAARLRLASALVDEAAGEVTAAPAQRHMTPDEALTALNEVRTHFAVQAPVLPTIAEDLTTSHR